MDALPQQVLRVIAERYEVVRVLGEGSAAKTLLCHDRVEDRHVALKELRVEHLEDWKHLELFQREAQVELSRDQEDPARSRGSFPVAVVVPAAGWR